MDKQLFYQYFTKCSWSIYRQHVTVRDTFQELAALCVAVSLLIEK